MDESDWDALKSFIMETKLEYKVVRAALVKLVTKENSDTFEKDFKARQLAFPGVETTNEL